MAMASPATDSLTGVTRAWARAAADGGGADEFARLYEHIAPSVHTWATLRIRPRERAVIEPGDLVQEVWLRAWRRIEDLDPDVVPFRYWVFRIAKNVLLEAGRQARKPDRRAIGGDDEGPGPLGDVADSITAVSRRLVRDENLARFRDVVEGLDADDRALVVHCGLEGLPLKDAGARLGISEEAAGKRWQRLRARLRDHPDLRDLPEHLLAGA